MTHVDTASSATDRADKLEALKRALAQSTAEAMKTGGDSSGGSQPPTTGTAALSSAPPSIFAKKPSASAGETSTEAPSDAASTTTGASTEPAAPLAPSGGDATAPKPSSLFANKAKPVIPRLDLTNLKGDTAAPIAPPTPAPNPTATASPANPTAPPKAAGLWVPAKQSDTYEDPGHKRTKERKSADGKVSGKAEAVRGTERQKYDRTEGSNVERGGAVGAKAEAKAKYEATVGDKDGLHATAAGQVKAGGKASAEVKAGGGSLHDIDGKTYGVYGELSAEAKARLEAMARQEGKLAVGDFASFAASVEGRAWIQARAKVAASGSIGTDGIVANVEARAGVEAGATVTVTTELEIGDLGLDAEAEAKFRAAAEVGGQGTFAVDGGGVTVGGEAYVFAGVEVKAEGEVRAKMYGRNVLGVKGTAAGHAGYKFGGGGFFEMRGGRLIVSFEVAGSVAMPAGATLGTGVAIDAKPVAVAVARGLSDLKWALNSEKAQKAMTNTDERKAKLVGLLQDYSDFKRKQLASKKSSEYVKIEKIQMHVKDCFPVSQLTDDSSPEAQRINQAIREAILQTIVAESGKQLEVTVSRGRVTRITNMAGPKSKAFEAAFESFGINTEEGKAEFTGFG